MRKIYSVAFTALFLSILCTTANAQRKVSSTPPVIKKLVAPVTNSVIGGTTAACDTVNYPISTNWSAVEYTADPDGYVLGNNAFGDLQKANYFDLSSTANTYILGLRIFFSTANSSIAGNLSKNIVFRIFNDNIGKP